MSEDKPMTSREAMDAAIQAKNKSGALKDAIAAAYAIDFATMRAELQAAREQINRDLNARLDLAYQRDELEKQLQAARGHLTDRDRHVDELNQQLQAARELTKQWSDLYSETLLELRTLSAPGATSEMDGPRLARSLLKQLQATQERTKDWESAHQAMKERGDYLEAELQAARDESKKVVVTLANERDELKWALHTAQAEIERLKGKRDAE